MNGDGQVKTRSRRTLLHCTAGVVLASATSACAVAASPGAERSSIDYERVYQEARQLSKASMRQSQDTLPEALKTLSYDEYRGIRFDSQKAIWRSERLPFQLQLFHLGYLYRHPVEINLIEKGRVIPVRYALRLFSGLKEPVSASLPNNLGFAGFRVHYPLNRADYHDELIAFLGASYFRALSRGQVYGASARGLAIDVGLGTPEEFPHFERFWIVRPEPGVRSLTIYTLMNSPSLTGAYQFIVHPGETTWIDVEARIYPRRDVAKLGIAPLTSMFLYGEAGPRPAGDFRPEVHDSDGLLAVVNDGEWIWRPLMNRPRTHVSAFQVATLRGFGLIQRDRDFDHYQDLEAQYDKRPSIWVEPGPNWPEGWLELLELPTETEGSDNIGAYWVVPKQQQEMQLAYRLGFPSGDPPGHGGTKAIATRFVPAAGGRQFMIDFDGPSLRALDVHAAVEGVVTASRGQITNVMTRRLPDDGSWRLFFDCTAEGPDPVELRGFLRSGDRTLSETWSFTWLPA